MATQYFLIIIGLQFQWLEFHIKIHGMAGKQCAFSDQNAGKRSLFLKLGLEFQLQLSGHPVRDWYMEDLYKVRTSARSGNLEILRGKWKDTRLRF